MISRTPKSRYADHIKEWDELTAQLATAAEEHPSLEPQRVMLEKVLAQAKDLTLQQANHQAAKQKISQQLRPLMGEGMKIATALRVNLKLAYGNRNDDLVKFGIQPFRGRASKVAPPPEGTPTPDPPGEPSTPPSAKQ
jgi:hypothetical protein